MSTAADPGASLGPGAPDPDAARAADAPAARSIAAGGPGAVADDEPPAPVIAARLSIQGFVDGWIHCQHVADYLARFAASDRFDPEQLTTRLSTYLNEALELVFRSRVHELDRSRGPEAGELVITIHRRSDRLQVELRCDGGAADGHARLRRSVARAAEPDAAAAYRRGFTALLDGDADEDAGLLELVALHGISLALRDEGAAVVLCMTVPHE